MTMLHSMIHEVQDASKSGSTKRQLRALTRITDLFLAGSARYSRQQVELFDEVFKVLVEAIELQTRIKLAHRFAADPAAPAVLLRAIAANGEAAVAGPVLSQSPVLTEPDLIASASTQGQNHLLAIAQRATISEAVTDILIERGEQQVVHTVARNAGAQISDDGFSELVLRAGADGELALHIGTRRDIPRHHFVRLLESASASVCSRIVAANPKLAEVVRETVTDVVDDINGEVRKHSTVHAKAKFRIKRLREWKDLREVDVHAGARSQNFEKTVAALAALAGCKIEIAERAILNENPGAVQIIARAAGCSWATVKALLLMTVAERKMSNAELDRARANFEGLELRTARRVLEFYEARRNMLAHASPTITTGETAKLEAMVG